MVLEAGGPGHGGDILSASGEGLVLLQLMVESRTRGCVPKRQTRGDVSLQHMSH